MHASSADRLTSQGKFGFVPAAFTAEMFEHTIRLRLVESPMLFYELVITVSNKCLPVLVVGTKTRPFASNCAAHCDGMTFVSNCDSSSFYGLFAAFPIRIPCRRWPPASHWNKDEGIDQAHSSFSHPHRKAGQGR